VKWVNGQSHRFHPAMFRDYDIRGVVNETLRVADAVALGMAFGSLLVEKGGHTVVVGRDGRISSPDFMEALVDGLTSTGITVTRIGLCPTPMLYYAVHALKADSGIMVTASHNPPHHNGFKMVMKGRSFFGADIQGLRQLAERGDFVSGVGKVQDAEMKEVYVGRLLRDAVFPVPLRVVWDCGNGAAGPVVQELIKHLPGEHKVMFPEVDGLFPNHHADPTVPENLTHLIAEVKATGADIGFAFDGDADRLGVVDSKGNILWGDKILTLLVEDILKRHPGAPIIADVKASQVLFDQIERLGGKAIMSRTGHSVIRTKLAECGGPLAGEMSGHIFFADGYHGYDDALYSAVRLLRVISAREGGLVQWLSELPVTFYTPEIRLPCTEDQLLAVVEDVAEQLVTEGRSVIDVDGVRVQCDDGWWLLRAANTQAELVIRCEAWSESGLEIIKLEVADRLREAGMGVPAELFTH